MAVSRPAYGILRNTAFRSESPADAIAVLAFGSYVEQKPVITRYLVQVRRDRLNILGRGQHAQRQCLCTAYQGLHRQAFCGRIFSAADGGCAARQSVLSGAYLQGSDRIFAAAVCSAPQDWRSADAAHHN